MPVAVSEGKVVDAAEKVVPPSVVKRYSKPQDTPGLPPVGTLVVSVAPAQTELTLGEGVETVGELGAATTVKTPLCPVAQKPPVPPY